MSFWDEGPSKNVRIAIFVGLGCGLPLLIAGPLMTMTIKASNNTMDSRFDSICMSRLNKIGKAMSMYEAANDQTLPNADRWIDATWSYIMPRDPADTTENFYQCPTIARQRTGEFGYSMNDLYSGKKDVKEGAEPLIFDSDEVGRNAHATIGSLCLPPRHNNHKQNNGLFPDLTVRRATRP